MKNTAISVATAVILLALTADSQEIRLSTFSFETGFSTMSASNIQLRAAVGEPLVGISKASTFAIGSGFLVDSLVGRILTEVINVGTTPTAFALMQNYPNPFNPTTTIRFDLPRATKVSLKVYDVLGREVVTLAQDHMKAGSYQVQWKANVASGIYFYRLQTEEFVETKKMILLR